MKSAHIHPAMFLALIGLSTVGCATAESGVDDLEDAAEDTAEETASSGQALTDSQGVGLLFESPGSFQARPLHPSRRRDGAGRVRRPAI